MNKPTRKQIVLIVTGIVIVVLIVYGFLPGAVKVETARVESAPMQVTVEEEGETSVEEHYRVSSSIAGFLHRVDLEPGDEVAAGAPLAVVRPPRSVLLDPRSRAEAEARIEAAGASLEQAEIQADQAITEQNRIERLAREGSATRQQLEQAQTEAARAVAARKAAQAELLAAKAAVDPASGVSSAETIPSPVDGVVLAVHRKSEGPVNTGEPLVDVGDTARLKVRVEVLSQDAVRITRGMRVVLDQWGGETPLEAVVTRVERQGRVVVSALGVEERRVEVTARIESPRELWSGLGSGYRVLARFIIWEEDDVLQVPAGALFRTDDGWAVFAVENDRAVRRTVTIGRQSGLAAQVLEGLSEEDVVIVHPGSDIGNGVKVEK